MAFSLFDSMVKIARQPVKRTDIEMLTEKNIREKIGTITESAEITAVFGEAITRAVAFTISELKEKVISDFSRDGISANPETTATIDSILTRVQMFILPRIPFMAKDAVTNTFSNLVYPEIGEKITAVIDHDAFNSLIKLARDCEIVISDDDNLDVIYKKIADRACFSLTPLQMAELFKFTYNGKFANIKFAQALLEKKWWKGYFPSEYWISELDSILSLCEDSSYERIEEMVSLVIVMTEIKFSTFVSIPRRAFEHTEFSEAIADWCFKKFGTSKPAEIWEKNGNITLLDAVGLMTVKVES